MARLSSIADSNGIETFVGPFNLFQGGLINGRIVVSVTSNNLTVAIKGLNGNNPSPTNPVWIRIGNAIRAITAALSVTKNAGTNWFNTGSAELATKEVDYFVYLIWNTTPATDIVDIGFSRIPFGRVYSNFSGTTTNEKYLAYGNVSAPTSTDDCVNIGRFAATLSAGAGYTWSVPTFTTANLIQSPIFETRWLSYTPVASAGSGSPVFGTLQGVYKVAYNILHTSQSLAMTNNNSAGNGIRGTLPFSPGTNYLIANGRENQTTGSMLQGTVGANYVAWLTYNNAHPTPTNSTNYTILGGLSVPMP